MIKVPIYYTRSLLFKNFCERFFNSEAPQSMPRFSTSKEADGMPVGGRWEADGMPVGRGGDG